MYNSKVILNSPENLIIRKNTDKLITAYDNGGKHEKPGVFGGEYSRVGIFKPRKNLNNRESRIIPKIRLGLIGLIW